jgi:group I intron endonuclease
MNGKGYIYLITNMVNLKRYVGQTSLTIAQRFWGHKADASARRNKSLLGAALRKYGAENFKIEEIACADIKLLNDLERHYISFFGTRNGIGHGYNLTDGGDGRPGPMPQVTRDKIASAHLGKPIPSLKGRRQSAAHLATLSAIRKGSKHRPCTPEQREILRQNANKRWDAERLRRENATDAYRTR